MSVHDTIGDFLTTLRNASRAGKASCTVDRSAMRLGLLTILKEEGYIADVQETQGADGHPKLAVKLKYIDNTPAITGIKRVSKPGRRLYYQHTEIPRVLGGLGIAILTTSKGVLKDREARRLKVGGELLCTVW